MRSRSRASWSSRVVRAMAASCVHGLSKPSLTNTPQAPKCVCKPRNFQALRARRNHGYVTSPWSGPLQSHIAVVALAAGRGYGRGWWDVRLPWNVWGWWCGSRAAGRGAGVGRRRGGPVMGEASAGGAR
jgi:hypothetical protein